MTLQLPHAFELIPAGVYAIARRECWSALYFVELEKPATGRCRIMNCLTGEDEALSAESVLANDWEVKF